MNPKVTKAFSFQLKPTNITNRGTKYIPIIKAMFDSCLFPVRFNFYTNNVIIFGVFWLIELLHCMWWVRKVFISRTWRTGQRPSFELLLRGSRSVFA